jgi:hypothetical protein
MTVRPHGVCYDAPPRKRSEEVFPKRGRKATKTLVIWLSVEQKLIYIVHICTL